MRKAITKVAVYFEDGKRIEYKDYDFSMHADHQKETRNIGGRPYRVRAGKTTIQIIGIERPREFRRLK